MFRSMRRFKQQLSEEECLEILSAEKRGTLAVLGDEGYPYALPINFYFDSEDRCIYFHSARAGHKADAMAANDKVCFNVHDQGVQREDWSYYVRSVILFGRASLVVDPVLSREKAKLFGMKYYPSEAEVEQELERDFPRMALYRIAIEHMTGKMVHEK